jgi:hypothetical protein
MTSRDEQRVIDALRAYTGGLIVTEQEIITAESRLRDRLEPPSPRRRLVILAAAVAAVLVAGFFAFQAIDSDESSAPPAKTPSSPAAALEKAVDGNTYGLSAEDFTAGAPPSAQDMAGFWMLRDPYYFPMFLESDGDWVIGSPGALAGYGRSTLDGSTWTRYHDNHGLCVTQNGMHNIFQSWRAGLAADGSLRLELTGGEPNCTPAGDREVWDRMAPGSPVDDYLAAAADEADWRDAPRSFAWQGLYVAPATGHVLEVADDGRFRYYDALTEASLVAADEGEIRFSGQEDRTTGTCTGGSFSSSAEVAQLPAVDGIVGSFEAVRVQPAGLCDSGLTTEDVWVNLF